jgi:hypothetical protein
MAFTAHMFTKYTNSLATKGVNMTSDNFRVILGNGTYATLAAGLLAVQDTAVTMTDVKAAAGWAEPTSALGGSNYTFNANSTSSGLALVSPTWTISGHVYTFTTATNPSWTTAGSAFNPGFAVFFDSSGTTDATNDAICWWDFGAAQLGTGGNYTLTINASGIFTATSS